MDLSAQLIVETTPTAHRRSILDALDRGHTADAHGHCRGHYGSVQFLWPCHVVLVARRARVLYPRPCRPATRGD